MNWYLKCFNQYADFTGRARRTEFWMFVLFNIIVAFLLCILGIIVMVAAGPDYAVFAFAPYFLYALAAILPALGVSVRRLHDTGKSGLWLLTAFIPFVNGIFSIILLVFYCIDGDKGPNKYGPDPKEM